MHGLDEPDRMPGGDISCFGGTGNEALNQTPGALVRGGDWGDRTAAGVFAVSATLDPSSLVLPYGFRCAR